jgi:cytochrome c oxidase accessory protein FixG
VATTVFQHPDTASALRDQPAKPAGVYPRRVSGRFRNIKWAALVLLLGIYYLLPWIRWDRGPAAPDQAILVDMAGRRLYFFWIEIWPQEIYFLTGVLVLAAFGLFLATALFGRVWCGFACPQTVWTDLFLWVERLIEGDRLARMRLDRQPLTVGKAIRKTIKHAAWLFIALATGGAWVMYFNDAPTVVRGFFTGAAGPVVYGFVGLFTATTYLLAGWAREQVCTTMCPWPRIQGALLDQDSLAVTYRAWRGEPRGPHKKGASWAGRGDCIDCEQCVVVCPTGVDIRDGLQLGCIGCGLCIDACNDVMAKVDRPPFLIAWDSARNQELLAAGQPANYRLLRPRTLIYAVLVAVVGLAMLAGLGLRSSTDINVLHDRNPLFVTLSDGSIRNGYTIKILNRRHEARLYRLSLAGGLPATYRVVGGEPETSDPVELRAMPDRVSTFQVYVTLPRSAVDRASRAIDFEATDPVAGTTARHTSVFRGPER